MQQIEAAKAASGEAADKDAVGGTEVAKDAT